MKLQKIRNDTEQAGDCNVTKLHMTSDLFLQYQKQAFEFKPCCNEQSKCHYKYIMSGMTLVHEGPQRHYTSETTSFRYTKMLKQGEYLLWWPQKVDLL